MSGGDFPILLSSAGRRVALLRLLCADAVALELRPRLIATDLVPSLSAACAEADLAVAAPPASHAEFGDFMLELCARQGVRLLVPTIDPELAPIAAIRDRLAAAGTLANISSPEAVAVARDKLLTARALGDLAAASELPEEVAKDPGAWSWPLIAKPRGGSSSAGVRLLHEPGALASLPAGMVVQQRLAGAEFTVNVYVADGRTIAAVPHLRREVRAGEVAKAITVRHAALQAIADRLPAMVPGLFGALCFQAIGGDAPKLIEINARFGGGFPLAHQAGAPFTRWLIEQAAGRGSSARDAWQEGVTMLRYDAAVFGFADLRSWLCGEASHPHPVPLPEGEGTVHREASDARVPSPGRREGTEA